jgi:hypothetical protein
VWERRKTKGKIAIQKMVVDLMELYLHRLKQRRPPYPLTPAMAHFVSQFPYEPTPDQKQVPLYVWLSVLVLTFHVTTQTQKAFFLLASFLQITYPLHNRLSLMLTKI